MSACLNINSLQPQRSCRRQCPSHFRYSLSRQCRRTPRRHRSASPPKRRRSLPPTCRPYWMRRQSSVRGRRTADPRTRPPNSNTRRWRQSGDGKNVDYRQHSTALSPPATHSRPPASICPPVQWGRGRCPLLFITTAAAGSLPTLMSMTQRRASWRSNSTQSWCRSKVKFLGQHEDAIAAYKWTLANARPLHCGLRKNRS